MKRAVRLGLIILGLPVVGLASAPLKTDRYQIHDRGQPRLFEVAKDEVHVITRAREHKLLRIPSQANAEAVRKYADSLRKATGDEVELVLYEVGVP